MSLLGELAGDLDDAAVGTVVAGPASAATDGGLVDVVRADQSLRGQVSTVDSVELPSGQIASVLALVGQTKGNAGGFGVAPGADVPLPSPSPSPS